MTNLIPPHAKKQLVTLYWVRVVSVWTLLWSIALLAGALLLWPSYLLISGTSAAYAETAASVSQRTEAYDAIVTELEQSSKEAVTIMRATQLQTMSSLMRDLWSNAGQGAQINGIQINRASSGLDPITLTGEATNRQSLASFRDRVAALPYVQSVNLPIENLAENRDITFTISVVLNPEGV